MGKFDDKDIIIGIRRQDKHTRIYTEFLYLKHKENFIRLARTSLSKEDKASCYNDAFIQLFKKIICGDFKEGHAIRPLFKKIYLSRCIDLFNKNTNNKSEPSQGTTDLPLHLTDKASTIIQDLISKEKLDELRAAINELSPTCKDIIEMHHLFGIPHRVIAQISPRINSISSSKTTLNRCMNKLTNMINPKKK